MNSNREFDALLQGIGITHTSRVSDGAHTRQVWWRDLHEVAPLVFR